MRWTPILMLVLSTPALGAESFHYQVRHEHLLGSCTGTLTFEPEGIRFESSKNHSLALSYLEFQQLGVEEHRIHLLTWEDRPRLLGKDRILHFDVLDGPLTAEVVRFLESRVERPVVSSLIPPATVRFVIPARHRGFLRGADGQLEIGDEALVFRTEEAGKSRYWRWEDVQGYGSTDRFQFRVSVQERTGGQLGETRNFVFSLKRQLPPEAMDFFWVRVHGPEVEGREFAGWE